MGEREASSATVYEEKRGSERGASPMRLTQSEATGETDHAPQCASASRRFRDGEASFVGVVGRSRRFRLASSPEKIPGGIRVFNPRTQSPAEVARAHHRRPAPARKGGGATYYGASRRGRWKPNPGSPLYVFFRFAIARTKLSHSACGTSARITAPFVFPLATCTSFTP